MHVDGVQQRPHRVLHAESSNGITIYTAIEWIDPSDNNLRCSCNCPGWTIWRDKANPRTCKHVNGLETGDMSDIVLVNPVADIQNAQQAVEAIDEQVVKPERLRGLRF